MSRIFYLELGNPTTPLEQVDQHQREIAESEGLVAHVSTKGRVLRLHSGLVVGGSMPHLRGPNQQCLTDFGIEGIGYADFEMGRGEHDQQIRDMFTIIFGLFDRVPDDAVLHYESAEVWLVRRGGQLLISDSDDLWRPEFLDMVPQPYQRVPLAFSDVT